MKLLLDACVLYPTVMREMLLGVAKKGAFRPLWSERLLEEWALAARKPGAGGEAIARGEIVLATNLFPDAKVTWSAALERRLWLPDPGDVHVLAAAIAGSADAIVTMNAKDFPRNILAEDGLKRVTPDEILMQILSESPELLQDVSNQVLQQARSLSGEAWTIRALLKKARLPRLGKALATQ